MSSDDEPVLLHINSGHEEEGQALQAVYGFRR